MKVSTRTSITSSLSARYELLSMGSTPSPNSIPELSLLSRKIDERRVKHFPVRAVKWGTPKETKGGFVVWFQRKRRLFVVLMLVLLVVTGCSSASHSSPEARGSESNAQMAADSEAGSQKAAMPQEAPAAAAPLANAKQSSAGLGPNITAHNRKMIYRAEVTMEVESFVQTRQRLHQLLAQYQGYVLSSSEQENEREKQGNLVLRIPQGGFTSFMNELDRLAIRIPVRSVQGEDVTEEYVDLASRLKAHQAVEARLLQFMAEAQKTEDLLKISSDLARVQEEIERIKGRMRYLDENVSFSTVSLFLIERKATARLNEVANESTWKQAWLSLNRSTLAVLDFLNGTIIFIAGMLPILVLLAIITIPLLIYLRKRRKKTPPANPPSLS
jgi:hypothetical protein